jgi:uncharacterized membrane protein
MTLLRQLRLRPWLLVAVALGASVLLLPVQLPLTTRGLLAWAVGVWCYLGFILTLMLRCDAASLQRRARAHADGSAVILLVAVAGACASLAAIVLELGRGSDALNALVVATVTGSWLLLPVEFALAYASLYHRSVTGPHGLEFPGDGGMPDFGDFLYFSITVASTSQTSDVTVSARPMRRLVLLHALLAFVFNMGVLALLINILAGVVR